MSPSKSAINCPSATSDDDVLVVSPPSSQPTSPAHLPADPSAALSNAAAKRKREVHQNKVWDSLDDVPCPRFPGSMGMLRVETPCKSREGTATMERDVPADTILVTRAVKCCEAPYSECTHFKYTKMCLLGPRCKFIHIVAVGMRQSVRPPAALKDESVPLSDLDASASSLLDSARPPSAVSRTEASTSAAYSPRPTSPAGSSSAVSEVEAASSANPRPPCAFRPRLVYQHNPYSMIPIRYSTAWSAVPAAPVVSVQSR